MPSYDIDDLRALVLKRLRVSDTTRYSVDNESDDYDWIDDSLNQGQEIFARETHCIRTPVILQPKANYRVYRLPEGFLDLEAAWYYDTGLTKGYKELSIVTIEELNNMFDDWRTDTGEPEYMYIDRIFGTNWTVGIYPIPESDGDEPTPDATYAQEVEWVCPLYTYNQDYITVSKTDGIVYFLNNTEDIIGEPATVNKCIWMEISRLPALIKDGSITATSGVDHPEIPKEYHNSIVDYAVADLLENNPEDSAEFKRSQLMKAKFLADIKSYIARRKKPITGRDVRSRAACWNWLGNMNFYSQQT